MKTFISDIARRLVDHPDQVSVNEIEGEQNSVFELRVGPGDLGKVIGKGGRIAGAMRVLIVSIGMKQKRRFTLEIIE